MALASFYFQGVPVVGFTWSVLRAVSSATLQVLYGELLNGETEVGLRWRAHSRGGGGRYLHVLCCKIGDRFFSRGIIC